MASYPKRLIEVDLPIKQISAHARREKSIRHGHISTLHIWWARRPLAACRAVICAALWPDPVDELCPPLFRERATQIITAFGKKAGSTQFTGKLSQEASRRWIDLSKGTLRLDAANPDDWLPLRQALLDFIADFANWDNSTHPDYLDTSRALTQIAHEALGGEPGTRPLVVDPFAGGGSIPLEALRVGADAFASDLNPVAVLLNKVVLEYIPKYGQRLADEVRKWGQWVKEEAEKELAEFYPKDPDGSTPIAYLWARTIISEAPDDGTGIPVEVPLMRSLWLAKKPGKNSALRWVRDAQGQVKTETMTVTYTDGITRQVRRPLLEIVKPDTARQVEAGTVARGTATCPVTGYTTPVTSVRRQLKTRHGGANDARLFCVVTTKPGQQGRFYRLPIEQDLDAVSKAADELARRKESHREKLSLVPDEPLPPQGTLGFRVQLYGMENWGNLFTSRQALALTSLTSLVLKTGEEADFTQSQSLSCAVETVLALALDKQVDSNTSLCSWRSTSQDIGHTFGRQALPMLWDFVEANVISGATRDWFNAVEGCLKAISSIDTEICEGQSGKADATVHPLADDSAQFFCSDPPYYDAVPYADLSDFFYVWLKRSLPSTVRVTFSEELTPKQNECIVDEVKGKDRHYFETTMAQAMAEACRILAPEGIGLVVFAHKSTSGWEAQLQAMVDAGWVMTGSWPIDTEMGSRLRAKDSAALASSIHLVCRPRENPDGSLRADIGDWRDVLQELPPRIHAWMPRLAKEGVVGADAIFACLGPALEIFSRYSRVEKSSGEVVTLREYLEQVWAAVSKEALGMIFDDADTSGFEEDARLTAMWLWTLSAGDGAAGAGLETAGEPLEDEEERSPKSPKTSGYTLEYDTARKIAQGLGVHLDKLTTLVEVKGDKATLLSVSRRALSLFGKTEAKTPSDRRQAKAAGKQLDLFATPTAADLGAGFDVGDPGVPKVGSTVLDRLHQTMILFSAGRSEALKGFLVNDGIGNDPRYWQLAQALSALYPRGSEEKRWVDGVLARKKGLGF